ncbi:hypothetical protein ABG067_003078 [Albugo candida]
MDVILAIRNYLEKIINDTHLAGMKALLLDTETTTIVSMVMSQSHILQHEVFLVELLQATQLHDEMLHLKAAVLLRPTFENVELLKKELKNPKFSQYHIFFTNNLPIEFLEQIAEADEKEAVIEIQEHYADYLAVSDTLFHLNIKESLASSMKYASPTTAGIVNSSGGARSNAVFDRNVQGLLAVLLSLKKRPTIRYQKGSDSAEKLAREVSAKIQLEQSGLFDFRRPEVQPLLYVLDRRDDPITPLLSQWSYQAMVHELLTLSENRVDLKNVPGIRKDMKEVVLSATCDPFFEKQMYSNFGDLGMAVKKLVDEYQAKTQTHENIQSIEDMQRFVENYPAFRSQSVAVSKHVTLMGELARLVGTDNLMDVSQLEQELACSDDHNNHFREVVAKLKHSHIKPQNKLRLAILYALRYETNSSVQIKVVKDLLASSGLSPRSIKLIDSFLKYGGANVRSGDLFGDRGLKKFMRAMTQGLQGVPNVYAQHVPPLILVAKLKHSHIKPQNKLRLAILYALRYETNSSVQIKVVKDLLASSGLSPRSIKLIDSFLKYGGANVRSGDLFGDRGLKKFMRAMTQGLQGVPNVYAQHVPPLIRCLESIVKGQLLDNEFGIVNGNVVPGIKKVRDVIVYICGGVTFEEAHKVAELNQKIQSSGQRIILGGPIIHNSSSFMHEVALAYGHAEDELGKTSSFTTVNIESL